MDVEAAEVFCRRFHEKGAGHVVITMGAKGQYVSNGDTLLKGEVVYVEPVDTMGAGDAFITAFILSLAHQGWKRGKECIGRLSPRRWQTEPLIRLKTVWWKEALAIRPLFELQDGGRYPYGSRFYPD